ncbi:MAG: SdpI family protein [FCB group bacterium]|jgi:uncharacterized membrane protein
MEKNNFFKREWLSLLILIIPFIIIAIYWNNFPARVPTHWNISNQIDSYSPKEIGLFLIPGMNVLMYILFLAIPRLDPRRENFKLFGTTYKILRISISALMLLLFVVIVLISLGMKLNVGQIVIYGTILLFLIIGNFMGNIRRNYFAGVRTPWTLHSEEVWRLTHRISGKVWVATSVLMLIISLIIDFKILAYVYFVYIAVIMLVPILYSYFIFKKLEKEGKIEEK